MCAAATEASSSVTAAAKEGDEGRSWAPEPGCATDRVKSNFLRQHQRRRFASRAALVKRVIRHLTTCGRSCGVRCTAREAQKGMEDDTRDDCQLVDSSTGAWECSL